MRWPRTECAVEVMGNDHLRVHRPRTVEQHEKQCVRGLATPGVGASTNADSGPNAFYENTAIPPDIPGRRRADRPATGRGALGKVGDMTAKAFEIQVQDDHLSRIAQTRKPILAFAELIWNAVDTDATRIDATLINNDPDGRVAIKGREQRARNPLCPSGGSVLASGWVIEAIAHPHHRRKSHSPRQVSAMDLRQLFSIPR